MYFVIHENLFSNIYKADIGGMAGFMLGMSVATIVALLDSVWLFVRDFKILYQPRTYQKSCLLLQVVSNILLCVYAPDHSDKAKVA